MDMFQRPLFLYQVKNAWVLSIFVTYMSMEKLNTIRSYKDKIKSGM